MTIKTFSDLIIVFDDEIASTNAYLADAELVEFDLLALDDDSTVSAYSDDDSTIASFDDQPDFQVPLSSGIERLEAALRRLHHYSQAMDALECEEDSLVFSRSTRRGPSRRREVVNYCEAMEEDSVILTRRRDVRQLARASTVDDEAMVEEDSLRLARSRVSSKASRKRRLDADCIAAESSPFVEGYDICVPLSPMDGGAGEESRRLGYFSS
jgi:hypothetical protein